MTYPKWSDWQSMAEAIAEFEGIVRWRTRTHHKHNRPAHPRGRAGRRHDCPSQARKGYLNSIQPHSQRRILDTHSRSGRRRKRESAAPADQTYLHSQIKAKLPSRRIILSRLSFVNMREYRASLSFLWLAGHSTVNPSFCKMFSLCLLTANA